MGDVKEVRDMGEVKDVWEILETRGIGEKELGEPLYKRENTDSN